MFCLSLLACGGGGLVDEQGKAIGSGSVRDDQEGLLSYMVLDDSIEEVLWVLNENETLNAVMRCASEKCEDFLTTLPPDRGSTVSVEPEEWFPAELKAQASTVVDGNLKGTNYDAKPVLTPEALSGRVSHIENSGYVVVAIQLRKKS